MTTNSLPSGYCLHINSCKNRSRTCADTSNQARAFPHTYILRYTLIKHCNFRSNCSAASIHRQCQTIPQHQAIASTSILAEITRELAQTHPIKRKASLTPPKVHINQTSPFQMQLWHRCNSPTTPNNSSPSGYCLHINSCKNHLITCKDKTNQARAFPHTYILRYTFIKHCHFECDCSVAAIHRQCQTIPQHEAIAFTSNLAKITWELAQTHPIKREPSLTHTS